MSDPFDEPVGLSHIRVGARSHEEGTMMKMKIAMSTLAVLSMAQMALAREPGTPTPMPSGATIGVPVGANPPPGFFYSNRNEYFSSTLYNDSGKTPIDVTVKASAQQFHWVPGYTIFGGSYRAMAIVPVLRGDMDASGNSSDEFGFGDITISPLNISWMIAPGIFVQSGLSLALPTGRFSTARGAVNLGSNAFSTSLDLGVSYLRDGWNLSADANYFINSENSDTHYRSGDEFLLNWTAMKDVGGFSIGPVGYVRQQVTSDRNRGGFYGGGITDKARQIGVGIGVSKTFGKVEVNVNYVHDFEVKNTLGGNKVMVNFSMPIGP